MNWFRRAKPKTFEERVASRPTTPPKITMPTPRPPGAIRPLTITGTLADLDGAGRNYLQDSIDRIVRIQAEQLEDACRIAQELGIGVAVVRSTNGNTHAWPNRLVPAGNSYHFPDIQSYLTFCKEQP